MNDVNHMIPLKLVYALNNADIRNTQENIPQNSRCTKCVEKHTLFKCNSSNL